MIAEGNDLGGLDGPADIPRESEVYRWFRIYKTVIEIMEYRQYLVSEESKNMEIAEFNHLYENGQLADKR